MINRSVSFHGVFSTWNFSKKILLLTVHPDYETTQFINTLIQQTLKILIRHSEARYSLWSKPCFFRYILKYRLIFQSPTGSLRLYCDSSLCDNFVLAYTSANHLPPMRRWCLTAPYVHILARNFGDSGQSSKHEVSAQRNNTAHYEGQDAEDADKRYSEMGLGSGPVPRK